ncbi:TIR domain-containing protein [Prosthecobacter sp.]|uniref:TIR domain-containing protein n=1 Tax=Prosthecobacter sp. TaxID=1965333 RepID=UPI0037834833
MPDDLQFDVFLSYSTKDREVVYGIAEQLKSDGVKVWFDEWQIKVTEGVNLGAKPSLKERAAAKLRDELDRKKKIEEGLERSRMLVLCMSANAFGTDWAELEPYTFRFRDPLNKERRFLPLRLDDTPIKASLAQLVYLDWRASSSPKEYERFVRFCVGTRHSASQFNIDKHIPFCIGQAAAINCVEIRKSHRQIITGSADGTIRLWDGRTGQCLRIMECHQGAIRCLAISPDSASLLSGSTNGSALLWDLNSGVLVQEFEVNDGWIVGVQFLDDGHRAAAKSYNGDVWLLDLDTGLASASAGGMFSYAVFSKNSGSWALIDSVRLGKTLEVTAGTWAESKKDKKKSYWIENKTTLKGHSAKIWSISFSKSGRNAVSVSVDRTVRFWDLDRQMCRGIAKTDSFCSVLSLGSESDMVVVGSLSQTATYWDIRKGEIVRKFKGHKKGSGIHASALSCDNAFAVTGAEHGEMLMWETASGRLLHRFEGHEDNIGIIAIAENGKFVVSGSDDCTVRIWSCEDGSRLHILKGHQKHITSIAVDRNCQRIVSASVDQTLRVWNAQSGECVFVLEGHKSGVWSTAISKDGRWAVSGSGSEQLLQDYIVRVWDLNSGLCVKELVGHTDVVIGVQILNNGKIISGGGNGLVYSWEYTLPCDEDSLTSRWDDQVQYSNAKVLLVGETHAGKTGLTNRLANGEWKPSEDSTVGAWSTQLKLKDDNIGQGVDREIWLWDFGGQADQRLIHQLFMDRAALILLLFNADQDDVLPGLRDWQTALRRSVKEKIPCYLVAGRIDTGFKASRGKLQAFAREQGLVYHETSAKTGEGCDQLRIAMICSIQWSQMERRTSPRIFKLIKDEILKLRDEGLVLHTFKELRELLWRRLPDEPRFTDEILQTVVVLLDGPGVLKELDYGTYILLAPEWINAYAQAVIRTLRSAENDLGVLPIRSIAEGKLIYQSIGRDGTAVEMKRLPPPEERIVLSEMERQLERRGLCLRQGDKLVFPSHCGRDRPAVIEHPSVFVSYAVKGFLDDIYATLVVKLADSESFKLKELWRDAADFVTLAGDYHMGIKLTRESGSDGDISVYFGKGVTQEEQVIFANYIDAHLGRSCEEAQRLRHYVCPHCNAPKGNSQVLMRKLMEKKQDADTECDGCGKRFLLWDALEKKFASDEVMKQVIELQVVDSLRLDSRRKGKLLALEVGARITSADQKCFEIPATEDEGIDMELEFTDDEGRGTGQRLYLQLKSGNSYLEKRKSGTEIFTIREQRWVEYWLAQSNPVMLVIGTFSEGGVRAAGKDKVEFSDVRWMEISSVLKRESANGTKPVKQIEFKGERLDMSSVRRWREKMLKV